VTKKDPQKVHCKKKGNRKPVRLAAGWGMGSKEGYANRYNWEKREKGQIFKAFPPQVSGWRK